MACRVLNVSRAAYYGSLSRPPSAREQADATLTATIGEVHARSRGTFGAPRVHADLRLGLGIRCGRKRVARLMAAAWLVGVSHQRKRAGAGPLPATHADLVQRRFTADGPDRLWFDSQPDALTEDNLMVVQTLADIATIRILQSREISRHEDLRNQLRGALSSRIPIAQAKGVIVGYPGNSWSMNVAFELLHAYSRRHNTKLAVVCDDVIAERLATSQLIH